MPLLLAAYQYRFARDIEALSRYLIDTDAIGWNTLGEDLLDGAPAHFGVVLHPHPIGPSSPIDNVHTSDGGPARRMVFDESNARDSWLEWAYVLHPHGIEVIALTRDTRGPVVGWDSDPLISYSDEPRLWRPDAHIPLAGPQPGTPALTATRTPAQPPLNPPPAPAPHRAHAVARLAPAPLPVTRPTSMEQPISRTTRLALTAAATAFLALTATACDGAGAQAPSRTTASAKPSPRPTATPAMTKQAALAVIRHYSQVNNQANVTDHENARVLDTVEAGPLYAMSLGGYKQDRGLPAKDRTSNELWSYELSTAHLYIPRFTPGAMRWFAAGITITGTKQVRLIVVAEQPQHSWQMVSVADLDGVGLPQIALDADGYATAVAADGSSVPAFNAGPLRTGVIDNFATGGTGSSRQYFTPTPASRHQISIHDKDTHQFGAIGTTVFAAADNIWTDSYGLKTTGGGALILFSHTHTQTDTGNPGWVLTPGPDERGWLGTANRRYSITDTFVCNDAAVIPSPTAKARLLGYSCGMTNAEGPAVGTHGV